MYVCVAYIYIYDSDGLLLVLLWFRFVVAVCIYTLVGPPTHPAGLWGGFKSV